MTLHIKQSPPLPYYLHSVIPKYLPQHQILKYPQPVFFKYEGKITVRYILNLFIFQTNGKTEWSRDCGNSILIWIFYELNFELLAALKFGSGAWVLKKREEKRLEAAQMKFLRHLLGITKLDKEKKPMY